MLCLLAHAQKFKNLEIDYLFEEDEPFGREWRGETAGKYVVITNQDSMVYIGIDERELKADIYGEAILEDNVSRVRCGLDEIVKLMNWKVKKLEGFLK